MSGKASRRPEKGGHPSQVAVDELVGHYEAGHLAETETRARALIAAYPRAAIVYNILGAALADLGRPEEAKTALVRAVKIKPDYAGGFNNLGNVLLCLDRTEAAVRSYRKAIKLAPHYADAYNNLGVAIQEKTPDEAAALYRKALEIAPDFAAAHRNLGTIAFDKTRFDEALAAYRRALSIAPDYHDALVNFAETCRVAENIGTEKFDDGFTDLVIRCLEDPEIESDAVAGTGQKLLARALDRLGFGADPELLFADIESTTARLARALLAASSISETKIEEWFVDLRAGFLEAVRAAPEEFLEALAYQSFFNEYVWPTQSAEEERLAALQTDIVASLARGQTPDSSQLLLLATYRPLHKIEAIRDWALRARDGSHDSSLTRALARLIAAPAREAEIAETIECLADVEDETSRAVRAQYEENPYPRWAGRTKIEPMSTSSVVLRDVAPNRPALATASTAPKVLIAGCGTGRQIVKAASLYRNAEILGIDLSLASLAYARVKAEEFGLTNISFAQADILGLGRLEQKFDIVECSGVLHHMADPQTGLRALIDRLADGGLLWLGLYSEIARRSIVAARALIAERGLQPSLEGIKAARDMVKTSEDKLIRSIAGSRDFCSASTVRDLLFHVHEQRFTLPQLSDLLAANGLEFLGFTFQNPAVKATYLQQFPEDPRALDLDKWHEFEEQYDKTFASMYQFWCRRAAVGGK